MTSGSIQWPQNVATAQPTQQSESIPDRDDLVEAILQGVANNDAENTPAPRRPDPRSAADARTRAANDSTVLQLMQRAQGQIKPRAQPPGNGGWVPNFGPLFQGPRGPQQQGPQQQQLPPGAGGKGGLFKAESKEAARRALAAEGRIDPSNPYAQDRADTRRRIDQLGIPRNGDNRIFIHDLGASHAAAITRTVGGRTALAQGADIRTDAPTRNEPAQGDRDKSIGDYLAKHPNTTVDDFALMNCQGLVGSVHNFARPIREAAIDAQAKNDGKKTFMNMSWGASPEGNANQMARAMLLSKPGTKLYEQTREALGGEPKLTRDGDRVRIDPEQVKTLKQKLIYPALDKEMKSERFQTAMRDARTGLENDLAQARKNGIMVFQAANNDFISAEAAGRPDMAISPTAGVKGLFRVGATDPNGAGTADDRIAPFSGAGRVNGAAAGMNIPTGVDDKGNATNVAGTSFASPLMAETAYLVSAANPRLSLDQIEKVLTDPRVARDIQGTDRDGAGVIDPFAATLVARNPNITAAQIEQVREALDKNPNAKFDLLANGGVRIRN